MPKRIAVIDEDLPRPLGPMLKKLGWKTLDVRDVGLRSFPDSDIISFAQKSKAVLFTGDWGFANILNFPPKKYFGIVILAFPNEMGVESVLKETKKALSALLPQALQGRLIIIEPGGRIRVRMDR
jgi:predicted nuclease of predicted toxin-antitoxin system